MAERSLWRFSEGWKTLLGRELDICVGRDDTYVDGSYSRRISIGLATNPLRSGDYIDASTSHVKTDPEQIH